MATVIPAQGENNMLQEWVSQETQNVHLFKNDITPDDDTVLTDFTEADFSGYVTLPLDFPDLVAQNGSNKAQAVATRVAFVHDGGSTPNSIFGWYVTFAGGELLACERFSSPVDMSALGSTINLDFSETVDQDV